MDFVYDLTEKLEAQRIDYFLVTIRTGVKTDAADVFYHFKDESSIQSLINVLHKLEQTPDLDLIRNAKKDKLKNDTSKKNTRKTRSSKKAKKPAARPRKKRPTRRRRKKNGDK